MKRPATKKEQVIEAIITHPDETFQMKDIAEQFPDFSQNSLQVLISRDLVKAKYITRTVPTRGKKPQIYKILKREPYTRIIPPKSDLQSVKRRKLTIEKKEPNELSMIQIGESIYYYIQKLKGKIQELSLSYSNLQSELNKEKNATKVFINERDKKIKELEEQIEVLKSANRRMTGKTFNLGEIANFK